MQSISLILFEVGIPFDVCMYLWMVECFVPLFFTVTLTSDLVLEKWCVEHIFFEVGIPNLVHHRMEKCHVPFFGHSDIDL